MKYLYDLHLISFIFNEDMILNQQMIRLCDIYEKIHRTLYSRNLVSQNTITIVPEV